MRYRSQPTNPMMPYRTPLSGASTNTTVEADGSTVKVAKHAGQMVVQSVGDAVLLSVPRLELRQILLVADDPHKEKT